MLNRRHAALHDALARRFVRLPEWRLLPEVSFSVYGERGVIDVIAWHARSGALVVIELKSEIVDVQELIGSLDRYRRLAPVIARERGLRPRTISTWLVVADGTTNRRAVSDHGLVFRSRYPTDGRAMREWLRDPTAEVAALSFLPYVHAANVPRVPSASRRVRRARVTLPRDQPSTKQPNEVPPTDLMPARHGEHPAEHSEGGS